LTAGTITVVNLDDSGSGSLRQAIADAAPGDTIDFAIVGTILVTNGALVIGKDLTIQGPGATNLVLNANLANRIFQVHTGTVSMVGISLINGSVAGHGGAVSNAGVLTMTQCVLSNNFTVPGHGGAIFNVGNLSVNQCIFTNDATLFDLGDGGAIFSAGWLYVADCTIQDCLAVGGGGIHLAAGATGEVRRTVMAANSTDADANGGAIENWGQMLVADCSFAGNVAISGSGSAICNFGTMTITNCVVAGGSSNGDPGGGAINNRGSCQMVDSRVTGNSASGGGGICNYANFLILRSTVEKNKAFYVGQGILNWNGQLTMVGCAIVSNVCQNCNAGGGFYVSTGIVNLVNCTISGNRSDTGGGIQNYRGTILLDSCTVAGNGTWNQGRGLYNVNGTFHIRNTIVASNKFLSVNGPDSDLAGSFVSDGYNLIGESDGSTGFANGVLQDLVGTKASPVDAKLGPLRNNGGPTVTHGLRFDSPAIDAGNGGGLGTDQRGSARPVDDPSVANASGGDGSDIGAYETDPSFRITSFVLSNNDVLITWSTGIGKTNALQRAAGIANGSYSNNFVDIYTVTNTAAPVINYSDVGAATNKARYYRVRVVP
jgi:hypothetical protein